MARVIVVPGLAVHAYAELPVRHLSDNGHVATLLDPPGWRGVDHDLERYGRNLAADIDHDGVPVDVLIGLSVGTQAATVAASLTSLGGQQVVLGVDDRDLRAHSWALDAYLDNTEPYSDVNVFLFEHGTKSPGIATPEEVAEVISRHGARAHFDGLDPERFPHDIGTLGRYGRIFAQLPRARKPWSPLGISDVLHGLADAGLFITTAG
jgi:hypothetical protein